MPDFNISHKSDSVEVNIFWKRATPADSKKKKNRKKSTLQPSAKPTKPPTSKLQQKAAPMATPKLTTAPKQKFQLSPMPTTTPSQRPPTPTRHPQPMPTSSLADKRLHLHSDATPQRRYFRRFHTNLRVQCKSTPSHHPSVNAIVTTRSSRQLHPRVRQEPIQQPQLSDAQDNESIGTTTHCRTVSAREPALSPREQQQHVPRRQLLPEAIQPSAGQ